MFFWRWEPILDVNNGVAMAVWCWFVCGDFVWEFCQLYEMFDMGRLGEVSFEMVSAISLELFPLEFDTEEMGDFAHEVD